MNGIGFHILYDAIDSNQAPLRAAIDHLLPRVINIVGGARKAQAFTFAKEMHLKYLNMRVIWRSWPDDGNHAKDRYKLFYHRDPSGKLIVDDASGCQRWIDDNQEALAAGLTVLTDNESTRADLDVYAEWQAIVIDLTGAKGWKVAVGRFATGNPHEEQYEQLDSMFEALNRWGELHCFSPNEYMSKDPSRNGGNVKRYELAINRAKQIGAWPFPVNIGEFGLLAMDGGNRLDPEAGYHDAKVGLGGKQSARFYIEQWKAWYRPDNVDVCFFCWGGDGTLKWDRCRIDNDYDFIRELLAALDDGELTPMVTHALPQSVAKPADAGIGRKVICRKFRNIRSGPSTLYHDDGDLPIGEIATVYDQRPYPEKLADNSIVNWWWMESEHGNGWIQSTGWAWENYKEVGMPPAVVIPPMVPPVETLPEVKRWAMGFEVVCTDEQGAILEEGFKHIFTGMALIGQIAGAGVRIIRTEVPL